jgi:hypothetical protein
MPDPDPRALQAAAALDELSAKVTLNAANGFAGCFALVPPGEGDVVTTLILDPSASPAVFWSLVSTKAKIALDQIAEDERAGSMGGFGRGR